MSRLFLYIALMLSACGQVEQNRSVVSWDHMRYSDHVAGDAAGFIKMGK